MADIIYDVPMDETPNSPIAYDYSVFGRHGKVHGCTFVPGYDGYAAHSGGYSYIISKNPVPDLSQIFTLVFWHRPVVPAGKPAPTGLLFQFAFADDSIQQYQADSIAIGQWQSIVVVKDASNAKVYIDGVLKGTIPFLVGNPVEWAIKQVQPGEGFPYTLPMTFGAGGTPYGMGDIDSVLIFNEPLTPDQVTEVLTPETRVFYKIDDIPFDEYGVYVESSHGVLDALELKEPTTVDWAGEHGQIIDLARPRYQPREIEFNCWIKGVGYLEFTEKFYNFYRLFQKPGLRRLKIEINKRKPLLYTVYMPDPTDNDKKWRKPDMVGRFTLKLKDPQPVRRVLRFTPTAQNGGVAKIRFSCSSVVNVYWGDGTHQDDVLAEDDLLISHTYTGGKPYYEIMITGEPDDIYNFSTNCITIWNRL